MKDYRLINVGKFFAMFCVIMMHSIRDNNNLIFKLVQIGCMAYFFFVSGFLFKDKNLFKNENESIITSCRCLLLNDRQNPVVADFLQIFFC